MKAVERKPSWLHAMCLAGEAAQLVDVLCPGCRRYVCRCRDGVWESYDPGVISGEDITVALILRRPLSRIIRRGATFTLRDVCGTHGLDPDGEYLAVHTCGLAPVGTCAFKPSAGRERGKPMQWPRNIIYPSTVSTDPWAVDMERSRA